MSRPLFAASALLALSAPAFAQTLPAPYVSHALDAVLIPINDDVRASFGLDGENGVLVLAVAPDGVADALGIEPGDVIAQVKGEAVADPIVLDEIVYDWISAGVFDFAFDSYRGGTLASLTTTITLEEYSEVIDLASVTAWESWTVEGFSYAEYSAEYSEEMVASYESSEEMIEETASSEEFSEEMTEDSSEAVEEESADAEMADESADDAGDEGGDEMADDGGDEAGDEGGDDAGGDEGGDE